MRSPILLPLLFAVGSHLNAAPNPDYFRDAEVKVLVKKAEFWRASLLKTAGHMKLPDSEGDGYIAWGVGSDVDTNQAHQAALIGACSQVRSLFPGKTVRFQFNMPNKQTVSFKVFAGRRLFIFTEVAQWQKGGKHKRAFVLLPQDQTQRK